jgi:hypothetical protein
MFRKSMLVMTLLTLLALTIGAVYAQDDDDDENGAAPAQQQPAQQPAQQTVLPDSTVTFLVVICESQAIINLTGTMQPGFDVYYQVFSGPERSGEALTGLRRAGVSGEYRFSERVPYIEGRTMPAGTVGSAYVSISHAGRPESSVFNETVNPIQEGCAEPLYPLRDGFAAGDAVPVADRAPASSILSPFGGVINPGYVPPEQPLVVIGPREEFQLPRQETPGIIFAECNTFPIAEPGILYDTDDIVIFWSWFAATPELVQEHIDTVNYSVTYYQVLPLPEPITRTAIEQRGNDYWVFYYARLGNLRPGQYYIEYKATWDRAISDGYEDFGPGTNNVMESSGCSFDIRRNPEGREVRHNPWPHVYMGQ